MKQLHCSYLLWISFEVSLKISLFLYQKTAFSLCSVMMALFYLILRGPVQKKILKLKTFIGVKPGRYRNNMMIK